MKSSKPVRARIGLLVMACLSAGAMLVAQNFWANKAFNEWSDEELKKFLTDSPWVKKVEVPRSAGPDDTSFFTVSIAWDSALPVRWAIVRAGMGKPGDVPAEGKVFLERPVNTYGIRLSGIPADWVAAIQGDPQSAKGSVLKIGKREIAVGQLAWAAAISRSGGAVPAAAPVVVGGRRRVTRADVAADNAARGGRGAAPATDFILLFPKQVPITTAERDSVDVNIKLGSFKFSKAFKLKDMMIAGKLEL